MTYVPSGTIPEPTADHRCSWCWGSHGCNLPCHATGNHRCFDDEDPADVCSEVDRNGLDWGGFDWGLYGGNEDETHPAWSPSDMPCPRCGSPTLISVQDVTTYRCCPASTCGCSRGSCGWSEALIPEVTR